MPVVDEKRLKGNYGAAYVTSILSAHCLVRPVAADTDVGVDLYCESITDGVPFLHFWVQVKAGDQCQLNDRGASAKCRFDKDHLRYWRSQPVPVFAALVPLEWPVRESPTVHVVDITTWTHENELENESVVLQSDFAWRPGRPEDISRFLSDTLPRVSTTIKYKDGVVSPIPTVTAEYIKRFALPKASTYQTNILHQIRRTAAWSVVSLLRLGDLCDDTAVFRSLLTRILEVFADDAHWGNHWENMFAQGISYHEDQRFTEAAALYGHAHQCILNDRDVSHLPEWRLNMELLRFLQECAEKGQNLPGESFFTGGT